MDQRANQWDSVWFSHLSPLKLSRINKSAVHEPTSQDEPLGGVVLQCGRSILPIQNYTLWMAQWLAQSTWRTPLIQLLWRCTKGHFFFMDDNALAHWGDITVERLLETGVPQMEELALSPDLNPRGNFCDCVIMCAFNSMTRGSIIKSEMPCLSRQ